MTWPFDTEDPMAGSVETTLPSSTVSSGFGSTLPTLSPAFSIAERAAA
jgi:hypothetical protein